MYNLLAIDIIYILARKRATGQGVSTKEIADNLGVSRTTVWRYIKTMVDEGIVRQHMFLYHLDAASPLVRAFVDANEKFEREYMTHNG